MSYTPYAPYEGQPLGGRERNLALAKEGVHKLYLAEFIAVAAAIVMTLVSVLVFLGSTSVTTVSETITVNGQVINVNSPSGAGAGALAALAGLAAVFAVLSIVVFVLVYQAFNLLSMYRPEEYSIGFTGVKIALAGLGLVLLGAVMLVASPVLAITLAFLGAIVAFIGKVLVWIALWRLSDEWQEGLIKAAVILDVIGLVVPLLSIVAAILYLIGFRSVEDRIERAMRMGPGAPAAAPSYPSY